MNPQKVLDVGALIYASQNRVIRAKALSLEFVLAQLSPLGFWADDDTHTHTHVPWSWQEPVL